MVNATKAAEMMTMKTTTTTTPKTVNGRHDDELNPNPSISAPVSSCAATTTSSAATSSTAATPLSTAAASTTASISDITAAEDTEFLGLLTGITEQAKSLSGVVEKIDAETKAEQKKQAEKDGGVRKRDVCVCLFVCFFNLTCVHPKVILHVYVN